MVGKHHHFTPQVLIFFSRIFPWLVGETHHFRKCPFTDWWLNQPIWNNMIVKLDDFPKVRGENQKYLSCHHLGTYWVVKTPPPRITATILGNPHLKCSECVESMRKFFRVTSLTSGGCQFFTFQPWTGNQTPFLPGPSPHGSETLKDPDIS